MEKDQLQVMTHERENNILKLQFMSMFFVMSQYDKITKWCTMLIMLSIISSTKSYMPVEYIYNSLSDMEVLIETEKQIIEEMEKHVKSEREITEIADSYLIELKDFTKSLNDTRGSLKSHMNTYRMIIQLNNSKSVDNIIKLIDSYERYKTLRYPTRRDMTGAMKGLLRLQTTYELDIKDLANGVLRTNFSQRGNLFTEYVTPMTASDCYQLGLVSEEETKKNIKIEWMMEAFNRHDEEKCAFCDLKTTDIIDNIITGYCVIGDLNKALQWCKYQYVTYLKTNQLKSIDFMEFIETCSAECEMAQLQSRQKNLEKETFTEYFSNNGKVALARALCRDGNMNILKSFQKRWMRCSYKTGPHSFLKLARIRAEQLYEEPDIWKFHNVITDTEIKDILRVTKGKLYEAGIGGKDSVNEYRTAKSIGINERSKLVTRILRRMTHYTDLLPDAVEPIEAINYGIGGHYDFHKDWAGSDAEFGPFGDKLATVILYLSDVEQGGAMVFLSLGLKIYPVKGAAVFFRNLTPEGLGDTRLLHQSCPVLRGSKWILVKWIHEIASDSCPLLHKSRFHRKSTKFLYQ